MLEKLKSLCCVCMSELACYFVSSFLAYQPWLPVPVVNRTLYAEHNSALILFDDHAMQATNKEQAITIKSSGGLSDDQIQQMVRDAEAFAGEDKKRKDAIEAKNEAETLLYSAEKSLNEYKVSKFVCMRHLPLSFPENRE